MSFQKSEMWVKSLFWKRRQFRCYLILPDRCLFCWLHLWWTGGFHKFPGRQKTSGREFLKKICYEISVVSHYESNDVLFHLTKGCSPWHNAFVMCQQMTKMTKRQNNCSFHENRYRISIVIFSSSRKWNSWD